MQSQTSRPRQALWNRLKPRYKLVASAPCIVGLLSLALAIFPGGWLLAISLGISTVEPVKQSPNGALFMLIFCGLMPVALFVGMWLARLAIAWCLVRFAEYSPSQARLALSWRAYPEAWFSSADKL